MSLVGDFMLAFDADPPFVSMCSRCRERAQVGKSFLCRYCKRDDAAKAVRTKRRRGVLNGWARGDMKIGGPATVRCPEPGCGAELPIARATEHSWCVHHKCIGADVRDDYFKAVLP